MTLPLVSTSDSIDIKLLDKLVISCDWLLTKSPVSSTLLVKSLRAEASAFNSKPSSIDVRLLCNSNKSWLTEVTLPSTEVTLLLRSFRADASAFNNKLFLDRSNSDCRSVISLPWVVIESWFCVVVVCKELIAEEFASVLGSVIATQDVPLYLFISLFFPEELFTHKSPETKVPVGVVVW